MELIKPKIDWYFKSSAYRDIYAKEKIKQTIDLYNNCLIKRKELDSVKIYEIAKIIRMYNVSCLLFNVKCSSAIKQFYINNKEDLEYFTELKENITVSKTELDVEKQEVGMLISKCKKYIKDMDMKMFILSSYKDCLLGYERDDICKQICSKCKNLVNVWEEEKEILGVDIKKYDMYNEQAVYNFNTLCEIYESKGNALSVSNININNEECEKSAENNQNNM